MFLAGAAGRALAQPRVRFPDRPGQWQFVLDEAGLLTAEDREEIETIAHQTLKQTAGNRTHAAKILGISRRTLQNKIKEYGIDL